MAREGLVIVDEAVIVEIVRPGTGEPVPEGEVGEVVVTVFNPDYPLIRFATGDLSAVLPGESPCGRTNMRIKGWLGRADQATKVRGMFVHPRQVHEIVRRQGGQRRARLVVGQEAGQDEMRLLARSVGRRTGWRRRWPRHGARSDRPARRGRAGGAGEPAERRQGHRGSASERLSADRTLFAADGLACRRGGRLVFAALSFAPGARRRPAPARARTAAASRPCCGCLRASCAPDAGTSPGQASDIRDDSPAHRARVHFVAHSRRA